MNAALGDGQAIGTIIDDEAPACGAPASYNPAVDQAFFIWQDCQSGEWITRQASAGGYRVFVGSVESSQPFTGVSTFSHESSDVFDASNPNQNQFDLKVSGPYEDGFTFSAPPGASLCVTVNTPNGAGILAGPDRTSVTSPFNPATLGACEVVEPTPVLSVDNVTVSEGAGAADFTVSLIPASTNPVTVDFTTSDRSAVAGLDYVANAGTLLFNAGETSQPVSVTLVNDSTQELQEEFDLLLSNSTGADIADDTGVGIINDDDGVACGAPAYNPATDRAVFVWRSCSTGAWSLRVATGGGYMVYTGSVSATENFTSVTPVSVEGGDDFDTSNPQLIDFVFRLVAPFEDGVNFAAPETADVCINIAAPANASVLVGPARIAAPLAFNPATLEPC